MGKTWREKLADDKDFPRVEPLTGGMAKKLGKGTIVIPRPSEVDALMRRVPKGRLVTINQLREILAKRHGATVACPICTGIFARIAAGAAGEQEDEGRKRVTPYWRTLRSGGELNDKYPGGIPRQKRKLEGEGHDVIAKGKRFLVDEFERRLVRPAVLGD